MNREDMLIIGCGGCGNKMADTLANLDDAYNVFFINTSKTDINSLENADDIDRNYYIISNSSNGTGRDRTFGKRLVGKKISSIINMILDSDKKDIWLISSFGGGSGSSIISSIFANLDMYIRENGAIDKTINLIGVLPKKDSAKIILQNTINTWNEILSYNSLNAMLFINNDSKINGKYLSETAINQNFVDDFDSIFDIPLENGRNFDNGNLEKLLIAKGCIYLYSFPNGEESIHVAIKNIENIKNNSVFATMDINEQETEKDNGLERIKCLYLGTSFSDENYIHEEALYFFKPIEDNFQGYNEEKNLLLLSGMMPPVHLIKGLQDELDDRLMNEDTKKEMDFSKFKVQTKDIETSTTTKQAVEAKPVINSGHKKKKRLRKNLLDGML